MKTWIKFCGTTSLDDARAAIDSGADALGFIFAPSKRRVTVAQAQEITSKLSPDVERIGVFVNETAEAIMEAVRQAALTAVQLHGDEGPEFAFRLHDHIAVIKTILVAPGFAERLDSL
jgi:phosphoribosylanthranilate isomerase